MSDLPLAKEWRRYLKDMDLLLAVENRQDAAESRSVKMSVAIGNHITSQSPRKPKDIKKSAHFQTLSLAQQEYYFEKCYYQAMRDYFEKKYTLKWMNQIIKAYGNIDAEWWWVDGFLDCRLSNGEIYKGNALIKGNHG